MTMSIEECVEVLEDMCNVDLTEREFEALSLAIQILSRLNEENIEKVIAGLMPNFIWGYVCRKCGGGGSGEERTNCPECNGVGITDWQTKGFSESLINSLVKEKE